MCVSCRKSNTVTGPRVRARTSLRPSGVNSPLPDARRSLKPVVTGRASPLPGLSGSSVVRKFRGRALASFRSMSQINTGESASRGRTGGLFDSRVWPRDTPAKEEEQRRKVVLGDEMQQDSSRAQNPEQSAFTDALRSSRHRAAGGGGLLNHFAPE